MLLVEKSSTVFNTEEVMRGALMYAKHTSWDEGISGIVTEANEKYIRLQFLPAINNVVNHAIIHAPDVVAGYWIIRYSSDGMSTVTEYVPEDPEEEGGE